MECRVTQEIGKSVSVDKVRALLSTQSTGSAEGEYVLRNCDPQQHTADILVSVLKIITSPILSSIMMMLVSKLHYII